MPAKESAPGAPTVFPDTSWGIVGSFRNVSQEAFDQAFRSLANRTWKAAYRYLRRRENLSDEDTRDMTQDLFVMLYVDHTLNRHDRGAGSFPTYLKSVLRRFSIHAYRARQAKKRGGHLNFLSLDLDGQSIPETDSDDPGKTPDDLYEQQLGESTWQRAMDRARTLFESTGRGMAFEIFLARTFEDAGHEELAARFGVSDARVRADLTDVLTRISEEAQAEIRQGTATEEEFKAQWEAFIRKRGG